jgi:hypothetical protein
MSERLRRLRWFAALYLGSIAVMVTGTYAFRGLLRLLF